MAWNRNGRRHRSRYVGTERGIYRMIRGARIEMGEFAEDNLHGASINVAAVLPRQDGDMRAVEQADRSRSSRRLNTEKGRRQVHAVNRWDGLGMRMSTALLCLTIVALGLMFLHLHGVSQVSEAQKVVASMEAALNYTTTHVADLQREYEHAAANANISEVARDMGLVSAKSVPAVELSVQEDVTYMPTSDALVLPADTLATILGN